MEVLPTVHLLDLENKYGGGSFCQKAIAGDKGITPEQAEDPTNRMSFNCRECYKVRYGEYPV